MSGSVAPTLQELQYAVDSDEVTSVVNNRFSGDWIALHMMSTVCRLTDQRNASYQFLRNGGMAFAKTLSALKADDLASAARVVDPSSGDSVQQLLQNTSVQKKGQGCFASDAKRIGNGLGHRWASQTVPERRSGIHGDLWPAAHLSDAQLGGYAASPSAGCTRRRGGSWVRGGGDGPLFAEVQRDAAKDCSRSCSTNGAIRVLDAIVFPTCFECATRNTGLSQRWCPHGLAGVVH